MDNNRVKDYIEEIFSPANRTVTGQFQKGQSGNPSGRRRTPQEFKIALQECEPAALERIMQHITDKKTPPATAQRASEYILNRLHGMPVQAVSGAENEDGSTQALTFEQMVHMLSK